jgi:acyl carrier protein
METDVDIEQRIKSLVLEYAQTPPGGPVLTAMSLRRDLSIDSLSLVALALRLGDELAVDLTQQEFDLSRLDTVGELIAFGRAVQKKEKENEHDAHETASRG